jgi:hypothetical protein
MKFLENAVNVFTMSILERLGLAWWVEIVTDNPACIYYFGPFLSEKKAIFYQTGYVEDLEQEEAQISVVNIKQYQPKELTICQGDC